MLTVIEFEKRLKNKSILVGITYLDRNGEVVRTHQFSGVIHNYIDGMISIKVDDSDEEFTLPPDEDSFVEATPGIYTIKSTGKVVENPDIISTWTVTLNQN